MISLKFHTWITPIIPWWKRMKISWPKHHKFIISTNYTKFSFSFDRGHRSTYIFKENSNIIIAMLFFI